MGVLEQYVISVAAASLVCALVLALPRKGSAGELVKLLCGAFLILTLLKPLSDFELRLPELPQWAGEGRDIAQEASIAAREALEGVIKDQLEAYICDKAKELGFRVQAEVTLSREGDPVPQRAVIHGEISPYERLLLEAILEEELGIPKEAQSWQSSSPRE